jgi:hypothetical protein
MLCESPHVRQANFICVGDADVILLFRIYDQVFFGNQLHPLVVAASGAPLRLKASGAMTSSGGKTTRFRQRMPDGTMQTWYQIALAARLFMNSFREGGRDVHVCGQLCTDRLDAMMRVMEHELIHLVEMLTFGHSSCSGTRFMTLAQRMFGHLHPRHGLVTAREHAAAKHQLRQGQAVEFVFQGKALRGFVNRINVRATVLVPDSAGVRYSDGKHYSKYLVPPASLRPAEVTA